MIVVEGTLYISLNSACSSLNISPKTIRKYIRERTDWNYFADLSQTEQNRLLNEHPEIQQLPSFPEGRPVRVGQTLYPTIVSCANAYNIDPSTVRKRINSRNPSFQDWFWAEESS